MPDESPFEGFGIPVPPELAAVLQQAHDRISIAADAEAARIDRFLTGLDVDGLLALRRILNTGDMRKTASANFWDGQIVAIMKFVRGVDPDTGKDPLQISTEEN